MRNIIHIGQLIVKFQCLSPGMKTIVQLAQSHYSNKRFNEISFASPAYDDVIKTGVLEVKRTSCIRTAGVHMFV